MKNPEITFENMPQAVAKVYDEVSLIRNDLIELKKNFHYWHDVSSLTDIELINLKFLSNM